MGVRRVAVHIDRLVLRGFEHADRHAVAAGLREELSRLFADPDVARRLTAGGDVARLRVGDITVDPGAAPQQVGAQAARGIGQETGQ